MLSGLRPNIGAQLPALNRALGRLLNADSQLGGRPALASQNVMKSRIRKAPNLSHEVGNPAIEAGSEVHDPIVNPLGVYATPKSDLSNEGGFSLTGGMPSAAPIWVPLARFRAALDAYQLKTGGTQQKVADDLGIGLAFLRNILYGQKKPGLETITKASALFNVPITEFLDDPGTSMVGQSVADLSEMKRFQATVMLQDMRSEDLTEQDWQTLFEDYIHARDRLRAMKARKDRA